MTHKTTEERIIEDISEIESKNKWFKPIRIIMGIFLLLIIITWLIPQYSVKSDPYPKNIPTIEEVIIHLTNITINEPIENNGDFLKYINPEDREIKQIADKIVTKSCDSNNENRKVCYAKAIFYFVRNNFNYVNDPRTYEYVKSAKESLITEGGDCDDSTVLLINLLESVGIQTRFVFIPSHVYVEANIPESLNKYKNEQDWIVLDGTCKECEFGELPYQNLNKQKVYLNI